MRTVTYRQYEPHPGWSEPRSAPLTTFIYDVPYLLCWGVVPPHHLLNEILNQGGGDAGMSPGADWHPFEISHEEYQELCADLELIDPLSLKHQARYIWIKAKRAPEFDDIADYVDWGRAITEKYRSEGQEEAERNIGAVDLDDTSPSESDGH